MELKLKPVSQSAIPEALKKVTHYRYLNQFEEAESICRDVLESDPENQLALRMLGLVLTDQFAGGARDRYAETEQLFQRLTDPYERAYYAGIAHERRAKAQLKAGHLPHSIHALFEEAMRSFETAEKIRPAGNDDAVLRWNRCARILQSLPRFETADEQFDASDSAPM